MEKGEGGGEGARVLGFGRRRRGCRGYLEARLVVFWCFKNGLTSRLINVIPATLSSFGDCNKHWEPCSGVVAIH